MTTVVPVGEFVTDEWYPGFKPAYDHAPWVVEPFRTPSYRELAALAGLDVFQDVA